MDASSLKYRNDHWPHGFSGGPAHQSSTDRIYLTHCKNVLEKAGYEVIGPKRARQRQELWEMLEVLRPRQ